MSPKLEGVVLARGLDCLCARCEAGAGRGARIVSMRARGHATGHSSRLLGAEGTTRADISQRKRLVQGSPIASMCHFVTGRPTATSIRAGAKVYLSRACSYSLGLGRSDAG